LAENQENAFSISMGYFMKLTNNVQATCNLLQHRGGSYLHEISGVKGVRDFCKISKQKAFLRLQTNGHVYVTKRYVFNNKTVKTLCVFSDGLTGYRGSI